jgi:Domain of unknown function (DUF397)
MTDERPWRKSNYSGSEANCVEVATWRKASYSGAQASCVEVADTTDIVLVRDTTNRRGGTLGFSAAAWRTFTNQLKQA